jgi:RND superfamily putative drug exporter
MNDVVGLALIDYTLLIISRFRDEIADGADRERVGAHDGDRGSHSAVLGDDCRPVDGRDGAVPDVFPEVVRVCRHRGGGLRPSPRSWWHLRRSCWRPANSLDVRRLARRILGPNPSASRSQTFWYRDEDAPCDSVGIAVVALLPPARRSWASSGLPDDRVLPTSLSTRQVSDELRNTSRSTPRETSPSSSGHRGPHPPI